MQRISFIKYHGAGNDFILIDNRTLSHSWNDPSFIRRVCHRHHGIGADGVILLDFSSLAHYRMRIFNADASEAAMCGNGIRCLCLLIRRLGDLRPEWTIETPAGILKCSIEGDGISVNLGTPKVLYWPIEFEESKLFVVDTGVPHAVLFVDHLEQVAAAEVGRKIRFHSLFAPQGVNVNFVTVKAPNQLIIRTYERGVEAETMACGTGAAASAFVSAQLLGFTSPVIVHPFSAQGHESMQFRFPSSMSGSCEIEMIGRASEVFEGTICCSGVGFSVGKIRGSPYNGSVVTKVSS